MKPIFDGVWDALDAITQFETGRNERPKSGNELLNPPYAVLSIIPGGDQDGPLSDSQVDVTIRFRVIAAGKSHSEALVVSDMCAAEMKPSKITITGRTVRRISKVAASSGADRDDDVATPIFFDIQIYEVDTVPT